MIQVATFQTHWRSVRYWESTRLLAIGAVLTLVALPLWGAEFPANTAEHVSITWRDHQAWFLFAIAALAAQGATIAAVVLTHRRKRLVEQRLAAIEAQHAAQLSTQLESALAHKRRYEEIMRRLLELSKNSLIMSEREICDLGLDIAVDASQSQIGYLHLVNDDQNTISLCTWNKQALVHCRANYDSHYPLEQAGIWADCARTRQTVVHNDYQSMTEKKATPEGHPPLLRHMSTPALDGKQVRMIVGVGNKASDYTDEDQQLLQLVASTLQSVVMRQRGEIALAESEDRFHFITDQSPSLVRITDASNLCTWVNASWLAFTGQTMAQARNQGWTDCIHPESLQACQTSFASHSATRTAFHMEYRLRRHDGQYRWVLDRGQPRLNADGVYQGYLVACLDITERKQAELEREIFETFFSMSHDMMAITGKDGYFKQVNQAFSSVLGYSREELMSQPFSEFLLPEDRQATLDEAQRQLHGGTTLNFENRYRCKDGSVRVLSWHGIADRAREVRYSTARDVTELRAIQQQLAKVAMAMEQTSQSIVITGTDARIEYVNRAFCEVSGYTAEEVMGQNPRVLQSGQTPLSKYVEMWAALVQGDSWQGEFANRRKNGATYIETVRISPVRQSDGQITHYLAIKEDITEQKRAAQTILESKVLLQKTIDSSVDWIFVKDLEHRFLLVNEPFAKAFGRVPDALVGHVDTDFIPLEMCLGNPQLGIVGQHEYDNAVFAGESIHIAQEEVSLIGDRPRMFETYKTPLRDAQQRIFAILCYQRDITDRVQTEQQQRSLEKQLQQAQKMEIIGHLTGGIAHDFNNILASMLGYTEIMQMSAEVRQHPLLETYLQEILQAGIRAKELVQQLLTFSQKREAVNQAIHVAPIVKEVVKLLQSTLPSSIAIELVIANQLPEVLLSPVQLHQVLMNLGVNARDAIAQTGTIEIQVSQVTLEDRQICASCHQSFDGSYLKMVVRDTGSGISPDDLARAFDPFFTTKAVGRGSGLGLSVVHGIVHAAKGHIQVLSTLAVGTEFCVYLPDQGSRTGRPDRPALQRDTDIVALPAHVLVVDDEPVIVGMLTALLQGIGCQVTGFTRSTEALLWFEANQQSVDLVITDLTMPDLTGVELVRALLTHRPGLPIIMCTGYSDSMSEEEAHQIGIRHLLIKPVPTKLLLERVAGCLHVQAVGVRYPYVGDQFTQRV
jgi:PAS domain S-box-containing protein